MGELTFDEFIQNQMGLTETQWTLVRHNLTQISMLAHAHVQALQSAGFTRGEAIQIYCAVHGGDARTMQLITPPTDDE